MFRFRDVIDLVLLAVAGALLVAGLAAYPHIPGPVLAAMLAAAALCVAPIGRREVEA